MMWAMRRIFTLFIIALSILCLYFRRSESEVLSTIKANDKSVDECFNLGFNKNVLQCKTCEKLQSIVGDLELNENCSACCLASSAEETYKFIVLEVDKRMLPGFPDIGDVIKEKKKLHLTVRYRIGKRPSLLMYKQKSDDTPAETVSVFTWDKDAIVDYIKSHYDA